MTSCWLVMLSDSEHGAPTVLRSFATEDSAKGYSAKYNDLIVEMEAQAGEDSYGYDARAYVKEQPQANEDAVKGLYVVYSAYLHDESRSQVPYIHQDIIDLEILVTSNKPGSLFVKTINAAVAAPGKVIILEDEDATGYARDKNGRTFYSTSKEVLLVARQEFIVANPYAAPVEDVKSVNDEDLPEWAKLLNEMGAEV